MARTPLFDAKQLVRNYLINGNFDYFQRRLTSTGFSGGTYIADRWRMSGSFTGTHTVSRQAFSIGQTAVPNEPQFFLRWDAVSSTTAVSLSQFVENVRLLAGKTVTLSFWARINSGLTAWQMQVQQSFGSGGSPSVAVTAATLPFTLTSSWAKYTLTFTLPSIAGKTLGTDLASDNTNINFSTVATSGSWNLDIAQVMLNEGIEAASFSRAGVNLAGELALCQRYFEKSYPLDVPIGTAENNFGATASTGTGTSGTTAMFPVFYRASKRTNPSIVWYRPSDGATGQNSQGTTTTQWSGPQSHMGTGSMSANSRSDVHWSSEADY